MGRSTLKMSACAGFIAQCFKVARRISVKRRPREYADIVHLEMGVVTQRQSVRVSGFGAFALPFRFGAGTLVVCFGMAPRRVVI